MNSNKILDLRFGSFPPSAAHDPRVSLHRPDVGHEHTAAPPAVLAGVLHGDYDYDWWDVLLRVQQGMVHNLVEKLHEEYMRQNQALQQVGGPGSCSVGHTIVNCYATGN